MTDLAQSHLSPIVPVNVLSRRGYLGAQPRAPARPAVFSLLDGGPDFQAGKPRGGDMRPLGRMLPTPSKAQRQSIQSAPLALVRKPMRPGIARRRSVGGNMQCVGSRTNQMALDGDMRVTGGPFEQFMA